MKKILAFLLLIIICTFVGCTEDQFKNTNNETDFSENTVSSVTETSSETNSNETETTKATESKTTESTIDKNKKMIAFTFDDGPSANTERILDVFRKYGGKATFFVVGDNIEYRTDTLRKIVDEGHEIGSHTWSHTNLTKINSKGIINDYNKMKDKIKEYTDYEISLLRPPYGAHDDYVKKTCKKMGVPIVLWDVDTLDWKTRNKSSIIKVIKKQAQSGSIILCHDLYDATAEAIESIVPRFVKDGYQLVTVTELLEANTGEIELGVGHYSRNEAY